MRSSTLISIILSFSVVSTQSSDDNGISSYCEKARRQPFWCGAVPVECCDDRGKCDRYIRAGETKYGLTNPDQEWSRRHCSCDRQLYRCVTKDMSSFSVGWVNLFGFSSETCFIETSFQTNKTSDRNKYEFVSLLDTLSTSGAKKIFLQQFNAAGWQRPT